MVLIKRLGALALLVGILFGFPALLVAAVGNPWPNGGLNELSLMSNSAVLGLISLVGWLVWLQLLLCALWEIPPALRHDPKGAGRLPVAVGGQQRAMRILVHTVLAVGVCTTVLGSHGAEADAAPLHPVTQVTHTATGADTTAPSSSTAAVDTPAGKSHGQEQEPSVQPKVLTKKGDTLWDLAEKHLGDGFRWREIANLNQGRSMPDGQVFNNNPRALELGWDLLLPEDATDLPGTRTAAAGGEWVVAEGDRLSDIASETTGDPATWPRLYEANKDVIGPDPDLIHPGQVLVLPGTASPAEGGTQQPGSPTHDGDAGRGNHRQQGGTDAGPATDGNEQSHGPVAPATPTAPSADDVTPETTRPTPSEQRTTDAAEADDGGGITALRALLASAGCLAVGALGLVAANRRRQFRRRRVGRAIATMPDELAQVERAIVEYGEEVQEDVEFLDRALRHVAACCQAADTPVPQLGAAVLGEEDLTLLFTQPATGEAPEGWTATDDGRAWMLPRWTYLEPELETQPAPYPALVTIGTDGSGRAWHVDLETLGVCGIGGEEDQIAGLVRFVVAELAVNRWAEGCEVLLTDGFGEEMVRLNPARLRQAGRDEALARATVLTGEMAEGEQNLDADLLDRRRDGLVLDTTHPVVVVVAARPEEEFVAEVEERQRSRVVVVHGAGESPTVELSGDGSAFLPMWGVSLTACSMAADQAAPMAEVMAATRNVADEPVPETPSDDGPLGRYARADGSLRQQYTEERHTEGNDPSSQLPEADEIYLATAATTAEDLAAVAPSVPEETRAELEALDPTLDQDIEDWFDESSPRPKVHLLGPVEVTARDGGDAHAIDNVAVTVAFIAYLACQERGVTGERAAADCGWKTQSTVQNRATNARFLLGTRPDGSDWLPDATKSEGARRGSTPTYELVGGTGGVLNSADLFVRLRFRAQQRGDAGCEQDLLTALSLVTGAPFEAATERRFKWLFAGQRHDHIMVSAIHDAAHLVATRAVAQGRTELVRRACEAARKASPHSDIAWLDLAAATEAESGRAAADELVRDEVVDRVDEDPPPRTESVLDRREWAG